MTRDDIIRMAREAGISVPWDQEPLPFALLERFAVLVVGSHQPQSSMSWREGYEIGVATEREAIARMIEDSPPMVSFAQNEMGGCVMCGFTPKLAALTIRERGAP
jgi:hypothetical protein